MWWQTRDGFIPWGAFFLFLRVRYAVLAEERVQLAQTLLHPTTLNSGSKGAKHRADEMLNRWMREAGITPPIR